MHPSQEDVCRRTFLSRAGVGLGACALSGLLARDGLAAAIEGNRSGTTSLVFLFVYFS